MLHLLLSVALEVKAKSKNLQGQGCVRVPTPVYAGTYTQTYVYTSIFVLTD